MRFKAIDWPLKTIILQSTRNISGFKRISLVLSASALPKRLKTYFICNSIFKAALQSSLNYKEIVPMTGSGTWAVSVRD